MRSYVNKKIHKGNDFIWYWGKGGGKNGGLGLAKKTNRGGKKKRREADPLLCMAEWGRKETGMGYTPKRPKKNFGWFPKRFTRGKTGEDYHGGPKMNSIDRLSKLVQ